MADQQVDKFISELSQILERNRQQRAATENELAKSDAQQVASGGDAAGNGLNASSGFAQGLKGGMGQKKPTDDKAGQEAINAKDYRDKSSAGRVGLAQNYARTQELLANNPYRDDSAGFERDFRDQQLMSKNPYAAAPADGVAEEQAKRSAQRAAIANGTSGPLGGAGQPAPGYGNPNDPYLNQDTTVPASMLSPSVTARGRVAAGQDSARTDQLLASNPYSQPAPEAIPYPTPQQPDMALLEAYQQYQQRRGGL